MSNQYVNPNPERHKPDPRFAMVTTAAYGRAIDAKRRTIVERCGPLGFREANRLAREALA